ncbi:unnamed protein product [Auanema sp. JU1783]|nr:unnamed protein product [Auanema sp. JU1783]
MELKVKLNNNELWEEFHKRTTEMIVTKTGRKMFPKLEYSILGMDPDLSYGLVLQIEQVDDNRYKFSNGEWKSCGRGEVQAGSLCSIAHHDGVMKGEQWMKQLIHFERVKITNNPLDTNPSHVYLQSMHKYIPVLSVYQLSPLSSDTPFLSTTSTAHKLVSRFRLESTEFIAVTAYQNEKIKDLKIEHNPFAKGFRDGGDRKRISSAADDLIVPAIKRSPPSPLTSVGAAALGTSAVTFSSPIMPVMNPLWYSYWNPYIFNPMLSPYRFDLTKQ